jgi:D-beta-D-heptose 7-phosphate kinase/D-beta-D-heptose 1-phosphate adenosyltransferase
MIIDNIYEDIEYLLIKISNWKSNGDRIVFTNGCFDLLHKGHVLYLEEAKALGDKLVVGLNSDESVKRLKGPSRPIKNIEDRIYVLSSLASVDAVIVFEEDTPLHLIKEIMPDILVKGGDWQPNQIVGSDEVLKNGGSVKSLKFIENHSTTAIVEKMNKS